jgi:hypothetical protein
MPEYIPLLGASRFEVVGELAVATRKASGLRGLLFLQSFSPTARTSAKKSGEALHVHVQYNVAADAHLT